MAKNRPLGATTSKDTATIERGLESVDSDLTVAELTAQEKNRFSQIDFNNRTVSNAEQVRRAKFAQPVTEDEFYDTQIQKGLDIAEPFLAEQHGSVQAIPGKLLPKNIKTYDASLEKVWKDPKYSLKAKKAFTEGAAVVSAKQNRQQEGQIIEDIIKGLNAQSKDIQNKIEYGHLRSIFNSAAQGIELLAGPARLGLQGEATGMAYQEAAQLIGYHEPDGPIDGFINLVAANAPTMSAALLAAMVPVVGPALSAGVIGSHMGTDMFYDLRRAGVEQSLARDMSILGGAALGAVEIFTGTALVKTARAVPGLRGLVGSASRAERLKLLRTAIGRGSTRLDDIARAGSTGKVNTLGMSKILKEVFSDTSRMQALTQLFRAGATEAFVGGVEEWLQEGMQMALTEGTLQVEGLEGILPRNIDGTVNMDEVLGQMGDAFVAGFFLEGLIGGAMAVRGLNTRLKTADFINQVKRQLRADIPEFSNESLDFVARHVVMESITEEEKLRKVNGGRDLTLKERANINATAIENAVANLRNNPLQAIMIDHGGSVNIEEFVPGQALTMTINGQKIAVVKSDTLTGSAGEAVAAQFHQSPSGAKSVGVSEELWLQLEEKGLNQNIIAINTYQGSTLGHEVVHAVIQQMEGESRDAVLDMFNVADSDVQEAPAEAFEEFQQEQRQQPVRATFRNVFAAAERLVRGPRASAAAKKRGFLSRIGKTIKTPTAATQDAQPSIKGEGPQGPVSQPLFPSVKASDNIRLRIETVDAKEQHDTKVQELRHRITEYIALYAGKFDMADSEQIALQRFLTGVVVAKLNNKPIPEFAEVSKHVGAINAIGGLVGGKTGLRAVARQISRDPVIKETSRSKRARRILNDFASNWAKRDVTATWSEAKEARLQQLLTNASKGALRLLDIKAGDPRVIATRADFEALAKELIPSGRFDEVLGGVRQMNTDAGVMRDKAKVDAAREIGSENDDINTEEALSREEFQAKAASTTGSVQPIGARVVGPTIKSIRRIGQLSEQRFEDVYLPLSEAAYVDIFRALDLPSDQNRSTHGIDGETTVLRVGNLEFDLQSSSDIRRLNDLTKLFGPMWAITAEAHHLKADTDLASAIKNLEEINTQLIDGTLYKSVSPKLRKRVAAASLFALFTQSDSTVPVTVADTSFDVAVDARITADDIVQFFISKGLPDDGSSVLLSELGTSETAGQLEAENAQRLGIPLIEGENLPVTSDLITKPGSAPVTISTDLTAQNAARETLRYLSEILTANLTAPEIRGMAGKSDRVGGDRGVAASPMATVARAINFKGEKNVSGLVGPLLQSKGEDIAREIGFILNKVMESYNLMSRIDLAGIEGAAAENVADSSPQDVKAALAAMVDEALSSKTLGAKADALATVQNIIRDITDPQSIVSAERAALLDEYLTADPEGEALVAEASRLQKSIDHYNKNVRNQALKDASIRTALAMRLVEFQEQSFALRDVRNMKVQTDGLKLHTAFMEIFGIQPEFKLRTILKNIAKRDMGIRNTAAQYSLAMHFAVDAMNTENAVETLSRQGIAVRNTIKALEAKSSLTNEENFKLAEYKRYLSVMPLSSEIVLGEGEFGGKIRHFIENEYSNMADENWNLIASGSRFAGQQEQFYSPRVFTEGKAAEEGETPENVFKVVTGRLLGRKFETLAPHLADGRILKFPDFFANYIAGNQDVANVLANQHMIDSNISSGFFKLGPDGGFKLLEAAGSKLMTLQVVGPNGKVLAANLATFEDAVSVQKAKGGDIRPQFRDVYAPTEIADFVNRITKTSTFRRTQFGLSLMAFNAKLKLIKIAWGMFHRRGLLWSAMIGGRAAPGTEWKLDDFTGRGDFLGKLKTRLDYGSRRQLGLDAILGNSRQFHALVHYGMTAFQVQDVGIKNLQFKTGLEKFTAGELRNVPTKQANLLISRMSDLTQRLQGEMFGVFGSSLKTATAFNEAQALLIKHGEKILEEKQASKNATPPALAPHHITYNSAFGKAEINEESYFSETEANIYRAVAGMANADFGGLNTDRLGASKTAQDTMRLLLLGPDWTASNVISVLKLYKKPGVGFSGVGTAFSGSDMEQEIYKMFWLRIIGRSLILATLINFAMAGLDDDDLMERYKKAVKRGKFNALKADISPAIHILGGSQQTDHYLNTLGHFLDPAKMISSPVKMMYHKSSAVAKPVVDLVAGTRFDQKRPTPITQIGQKGLYTWESNRRGPLGPAEWPSYMVYQVLQTLPIQARNVFDVLEGEANVVTGSMKAGLGLDVSRTYDKMGSDKGK